MSQLAKLVSGGQTGADRAALDAAMEAGVALGGWCPEGRKAEDGVIPSRYPLTELPGGDYLQRTRKNVADSDGTAIIFFAYLSGGTERTLEFCLLEKKPYLLIDAGKLSAERAAWRVREFILNHSIKVLNIAGPRASEEENAYDYTRRVIQLYLLN